MRIVFSISRSFRLSRYRELTQLSSRGFKSKTTFNSSNRYFCQIPSTARLTVGNTKTFRRNFTTESEAIETATHTLKTLSPENFVLELKKENITRCFVANVNGELKYSHEALQTLLKESDLKELEFEHEAIFFNTGLRTGCFMSAFVWKTHRGQAVGGVDYRPLSSMAELILEGNRFSKGLGIKAALAGMWAGGGKGFIIAPPNRQFDPEYRQNAFLDYGDFLTSLNGCFVAGAGIGSSVTDMDTVFSETRYISNISPVYGGSVNTAMYTGLGVVSAMEAALEFLMMGSLRGKTVAIQGAGNVGQVIIDQLLDRDVRHIYVSECNNIRADDVTDRFALKADGRLTVSKVSFEDTSIFRTPCDIFSPCARGKVLNETTIPMLDTKIVCGSSNLPLETEDDHVALMEKKITYVTDVVPNRMGIISKLLEPYGRMPEDPDMLKHLSRDWEHSIYQTTLRILQYAAEHNIHPEKAAYILGEELSNNPHPLLPGRTHNLLNSLMESDWAKGKDFWNKRLSFISDRML